MDPVADILARAAATLAASDDLDASVGALLEVAAESLGSSFAAVTLQDPDRAGLQVAVAFGADAAARDEFETAYVGPDGPVAQTAADRVARMGEDLIHLPLAVTRGGIDQLVGVLTIGRAGDAEPDDDERTTLGALAALIAVAIDRARLGSMIAERSEWFERMAHTDPLTGLANERTFGRILELELARAGRQGGEVSLALFDVDDLTAINETVGHAAGDDVLRAVAAVLAELVRLVDTVARIGGDEFVLVAPGSAGIDRRPARPRRDRRAAAGRGVARSRSRPGSPASRSMAGPPRTSVPRPTRRSATPGPPAAGRSRHHRHPPPRADRRTANASAGARSGRPGGDPAGDHRWRGARPTRRRLEGQRDRHPGSTGRRRRRERPEPLGVGRERADRDRRGRICADHPRLVDLAARRRGEAAHRELHLAIGATPRRCRSGRRRHRGRGSPPGRRSSRPGRGPRRRLRHTPGRSRGPGEVRRSRRRGPR